MGQFIAGQALASAIQDVCSGGQVRCAVAFWGQGIPNLLFGVNIPKARIICDIEMGGTNPVALKELRAPKNKSLRHYPRLHAKVYVSDKGVVTTSANASLYGLGGTDQSPKLTEAGIHSTPNSEHWEEAARWFEKLWLTSKELNSDVLKRAEESWKRAANDRAPLDRLYVDKPLRLSDLLRHHPGAFGKIRFFFTSQPGDQETIDAAIEEAEEVDGVALAQSLRGMLATTGWDGTIYVPSRFISVHRGPLGANWATLSSRGFYNEAHDVYFAHRHQLDDPLFLELQRYLDIGRYGSWGGYRLGRNHFSAEQFDNLVGPFRTAEEVSQVLLGK